MTTDRPTGRRLPSRLKALYVEPFQTECFSVNTNVVNFVLSLGKSAIFFRITNDETARFPKNDHTQNLFIFGRRTRGARRSGIEIAKSFLSNDYFSTVWPREGCDVKCERKIHYCTVTHVPRSFGFVWLIRARVNFKVLRRLFENIEQHFCDYSRRYCEQIQPRAVDDVNNYRLWETTRRAGWFIDFSFGLGARVDSVNRIGGVGRKTIRTKTRKTRSKPKSNEKNTTPCVSFRQNKIYRQSSNNLTRSFFVRFCEPWNLRNSDLSVVRPQ